MRECRIEVSEPEHFRLREILWINAIGVPLGAIIGGLGVTAIAAILLGGVLRELTILAIGCVCLIAVATGLFFMPAMWANPYVVRLVRKHVRDAATPDAGFIVQVALRPRLHSGFRGWMEDADDIGVLHVTPRGIVFTGDHTVVELPFQKGMTFSVHNIGWRGFWFCGKRIRVHSDLPKGYEFVEFADRSGWSLLSATRRPREILTQISSMRNETTQPKDGQLSSESGPSASPDEVSS